MSSMTPQQYVDAWKSGLTSANAQAKFKRGVQAVTENPMAKAASAASRAKYQQQTAMAAQDGGAMETKLMAASFQGWKDTTSNVGSANMVTGATKGAAKLAAVAGKLIAAQAAAKAAAAQETSPLGKVAASIRALQSAFGKQVTV